MDQGDPPPPELDSFNDGWRAPPPAGADAPAPRPSEESDRAASQPAEAGFGDLDAGLSATADDFFSPIEPKKPRGPGEWGALHYGALLVGAVALVSALGFAGSLLVSTSDNFTTDLAADARSDDLGETGSDSSDTSGSDADSPEVDNTNFITGVPDFDSVLGVAPPGRGWEFQAAPNVVPDGVNGPAIEVAPGDNIVAALETAPRNAVFRFAAGVYQDVELVPRDGDSFLGFGQAILDGSTAGDGSAAFTGAAKDVTISGFEVRNYGNVSQNGAINAQIGGSDNPPAQHRSRGWTLEDLNVHGNNGVGINIGPFGQVRRVRIHSNGQLGITSHGGRAIIVEDCEIDSNNTQEMDPGFEGGGSKFKYTFDLVVRNCYFHDNFGYGLWTDIDNYNVLFEDNLIENETWSCISHEVSFDAVIRNNVVRNCGTDGDPWLWKAGIQIANSPDVLVENNVIENSFNGIGLIQQDRGNPDWELKNVVVRNNTITNSGQSGAVTDTRTADGEPTLPDDTVVFEDNTWEAGLPSFEGDLTQAVDTIRSRRTADFRWGIRQLDWNGWLDLDQDTTGTFQAR